MGIDTGREGLDGVERAGWGAQGPRELKKEHLTPNGEVASRTAAGRMAKGYRKHGGRGMECG